MKYKVLVVEDNLITAMSIKLLLEQEGYEIVKSVYAEDAYDLYMGQNSDLILLDFMLKGKMTGLDAAEEIRKVSDTPIIFLTALSDEKTLVNLEKISNAKMVTKPFTEESLLIEVKSMIAV